MTASRLGVGNPTDLFWCPIEGGDRSFVRLDSGRLGTLLAKVDPDRFESESLIQCKGCKTTFDSAVCDVLTNHEMAKRTDRAARHLFGSLLAACPEDEDLAAAVHSAMAPYLVTDEPIDVSRDHGDPLADVVEVLDRSARMGMLERAVRASVTGGRIRARHLSLLVHAAESFGVSQRWIRSRILAHRRIG